MNKPYEDRVPLDTFKPDYTKPAKTLLVDLLNYANRHVLGYVIKPHEIHFTKPVKTAEGDNENTRIRIAFMEHFNVTTGTQELKYNRLDIQLLATSMHFNGLVFIDKPEELKTTVDLLPYIRDVLPIHLDAEDIVEETIYVQLQDLGKEGQLEVNENNIFEDTEVEIELYPYYYINIHPDCLAYTGKLKVELRPKPVNIENIVKVTRLGDFSPYKVAN